MKLKKLFIAGAIALLSYMPLNTQNNKSYQHYVTPLSETIDKYAGNAYCVRCVATYKDNRNQLGALTIGHATATLFSKKGLDNYFLSAYHIFDEDKNISARKILESKYWKSMTGFKFEEFSLYLVDNKLDDNPKDDVLLKILDKKKSLDVIILNMTQELNDRRWKYAPIKIGAGNKLKEGDILYATGYHHSIHKVTTKGIFAGQGGKIIDDCLASIILNPGCSGCGIYALRNDKIEFVGMFHAYFSPTQGNPPVGIHYVVPVDKFKGVLEKYMK